LNHRDVLVIGAGPAGLAVAKACAQNDLSVTVVAPDFDQLWGQNFGVWEDELAQSDYTDLFEATWSSPSLWFDNEKLVLNRRYGLLSTAKLQARLLADIEQAGVARISGVVETITHQDSHATVHLENEKAINAKVVIDASGGKSPFVLRKSKFKQAFQMAYGLWIEVKKHPFSENEMTLMDFRQVPGFSPHTPSFLYALPISETRLFVEETSLAGRPAMSFDDLKSRLELRLAHLGLKVEKVHSEENCRIPMGLPLPRKNQRLLAYGVAASMVHPASGYQIARALTEAPKIGNVLANELKTSTPAAAVQAGWEIIWPKPRVHSWELYTFGMNFLTKLNNTKTQAFFKAFFSLKEEDLQAYLSATLSPKELSDVMKNMYANVDGSLRWDLFRESMSPGGLPLLKTVFQR
jgi:lycopene cyclase-like protein